VGYLRQPYKLFFCSSQITLSFLQKIKFDVLINLVDLLQHANQRSLSFKHFPHNEIVFFSVGIFESNAFNVYDI
jgi:hypothetical protein